MNVLEVVRPFIKKSRIRGNRITGLCPFHPDKKPSFSMSLEAGKEGLYYCFSCHASGNLAIFLRKMKVASSAIDRLVSSLSRSIRKTRYKRDTTGEESFLPESILGAFHECPNSLLDAGFSMTILDDYDIGFDDVLQRITFPLRTEWGQLIGISGRAAYGEVEPRYIIYTEKDFSTFENYNRPKKDFLWNLDRVYAKYLNSDAREPIIIVEGFKVCLWLIQHGYKNTAALVGNNMSKSQERLLEHLPGEFVLALDNDEAGRGGTNQIGRKLNRIPQASVKVVNPQLLDRLDIHQLDELDLNGLQNVLGRTVSFMEYSQWHKRKETTSEPNY